MIRIASLVAAAVVLSTSAFAGETYNFRIGGQSIHIEQPRGCNTAACATISIPGIYEQNTKRKRPREADINQASVVKEKKDTELKPAPPAAAVSKSLEPANGLASQEAAPPAAPSVGLSTPKIAALEPTPVPSVDSPSVASPVGVWITEEKEGKVRIEPCGNQLCGYAVDAKTNANGDKVLINMKPGKDKWSGKVHDPKSGSNYDSTIAMNGPDRLRVQGCAFGGMFCGGQTWTRVN